MTEGKTNPSWVNDTVSMKLANLSNIGMTAMFDTKDKNRLTAGKWISLRQGKSKYQNLPCFTGNQLELLCGWLK